MEEMLEEVRVEAKTIVTGIPSSAFDEFKNRPDFCNSKSWGLFVAFHVLPFDVVAKLLNPLLKEGKLAMTMPEKPQSKWQRYYKI